MLHTSSIDEIIEDINEAHAMGITLEYKDKQMHRLPPAPVVDRVSYIVAACRGKRVLHLGCGWPPSALHKALYEVTSSVDGVDINVPQDEDGKHNGRGGLYARVDLDQASDLSNFLLFLQPVDLVVCAEILEHLGNPGQLLCALKDLDRPVLITVPNAFSKVGRAHITGGIECVNRQHVAYFSYTTIKELVTRYGYAIEEFGWYNQPRHAQSQESEGLIFLVR